MLNARVFELSRIKFYGFLRLCWVDGSCVIFQYVENMEPCLLCITQRVFVILVGIIALIAALHNPEAIGRALYSMALIIAALGGAGFAARHVWIQGLPEGKVPACAPSFEYMLEAFPFMQTLEFLLKGDGDCAKQDWFFLGLSMPSWVFVAFICIALVGCWQLIRRS